MASEDGFVNSTLTSLYIAIGLCFIILLLSTKNLLVSFIAIFCVAIVVTTIGYIIVELNWQLGISESLCVVTAIGLSVDYCVHLASDYLHSPHANRRAKMQQTYQNMGVSISAGAITTLGSSAFLFGGKIISFTKFATILCSTIVMSYLVSMLLFGSIMHICGPQKGCCDLNQCCQSKDVEEEDEMDIDFNQS